MATGFRASVRQLFLEKYTASLALGYENSDYTDITGSSTTDFDRNDNYFWFRPTLDYQFDEHWSMGAFYQYRTKSSDTPSDGDLGVDPYDYSNHQIGLYSNYKF